MTDYQKMYQEKLTTPDKIAQQVQSGWLLGMDTATSQTPAIMTAIAERIRNSDITGVKVQALLDAYPFEFYTDPTLAGKMTGYSWFSSSAARKAVNAGYADIIPAYYRDFPTRIRTEYDYDAVCVEVAPMDRHGYFSLALNGSYIDAMLDKTKRIFLEVNDRQPRGLCGSLIHISQVDAIVEYNHDLPVLPPVQLDEVSKTIGGLIAERIPDGACLQLGIGAIPDATGMALKAKHDLGIHTEMFTDSMVELIECGAVNNSKKQIHRGKTVTTFAFGSQRIYDYIDDNPAVEILPVEYVNDPDVICQNDNMISINAAVEVDLFGQVCAESVGTKHMSGSGGQIDYVRGACQSRGGKSFIAFTSTAKGGTIDSKYLDWHISKPYLVLIALNFAGLLAGFWKAFASPDPEYLTLAINMGWIVYNLMVLGATMAVAVEDVQKDKFPRVPLNLSAKIVLPDGSELPAEVCEFSQEGVRVLAAQGNDAEFAALLTMPAGETLQIELPADDGRREVFRASLAPEDPTRTDLPKGGRDLIFEFESYADERRFNSLTFSRRGIWAKKPDETVDDRFITGFLELGRIALYGYRSMIEFLPGKMLPAFRDLIGSLLPRTPRREKDLVGLR